MSFVQPLASPNSVVKERAGRVWIGVLCFGTGRIPKACLKVARVKHLAIVQHGLGGMVPSYRSILGRLARSNKLVSNSRVETSQKD